MVTYAWAWYVKYSLDAYALGPYRFTDPVSEAYVREHCELLFGESPSEVWTSGSTIEREEETGRINV